MADNPLPPVQGEPAGEPASNANEETESSSSEESVHTLLLFDEEEADENESELGYMSEESVQSEFKLEALGPTNEKVIYLNRVKSALGENSNKYSTFYEMVVKHETQRLGLLRFRRRARSLLKDHTELIMGLNIFLPDEIRIAVPSPMEDKGQAFRDFTKLVKKRYIDDQPRIRAFLDICDKVGRREITVTESRPQIRQLLHDSPDLLLDVDDTVSG